VGDPRSGHSLKTVQNRRNPRMTGTHDNLRRGQKGAGAISKIQDFRDEPPVARM
jgi:hypothetical protein